jgi:hypothetical protein
MSQAKHTDLIPGAGTDVDSQIESLSAFTEGSGISSVVPNICLEMKVLHSFLYGMNLTYTKTVLIVVFCRFLDYHAIEFGSSPVSWTSVASLGSIDPNTRLKRRVSRLGSAGLRRQKPCLQYLVW